MNQTHDAAQTLTHIDTQGRAKMVDVSQKAATARLAIARGWVQMQPQTLQRIAEGQIKKGDVLAVAQVAGIMAAKKTSELIPMCHPLMIAGMEMRFRLDYDLNRVEIEASVNLMAQTGIEMEALTAVSVAALTIYDMCKAIDRAMVIGEIRLIYKEGGKSGIFKREGEPEWEK